MRHIKSSIRRASSLSIAATSACRCSFKRSLIAAKLNEEIGRPRRLDMATATEVTFKSRCFGLTA